MAMYCVSIVVILTIQNLGLTAEGSFENSMLVTKILNDGETSQDVYIIPGTPYDLRRNFSIVYESLTLNVPAPHASIFSCGVDYSIKKVYLYDRNKASIEVVHDFDWTNTFANLSLKEFHVGVSRSFPKIAVDWISHNVIWTDPHYRRIIMQPGDLKTVDTTQYRTIVEDDLERPFGLAVDPINGYLFWGDIGSTPKIERSSITGVDRTTLISTGLATPYSITCDLITKRIYFVDSTRDTIESADYSGKMRKIIRRLSHSELIDIAIFRDTVAVTDYAKGQLWMLNKLNGEQFAKSVGLSSGKLIGLAMYSSVVQPLKTSYCNETTCSDMCVSGTSQAECLCRDGYQLKSDGVTCEENEGSLHRALVLTNTSSICLVDIRALASDVYAENSTCILSTDSEITHIDIDAAERKVIYTNGDAIYTVSIGTNPVSERLIYAKNITGLSLDWTDRNIYFSKGTTKGSINVVSQATLTTYTLIDKNVSRPRDLVVLPFDRHMFWLSGIYGSNAIEKANLDGTERKTIVASGALGFPKSLTYDTLNNAIYWSDNGYVMRCQPDGTGKETVGKGVLNNPNLLLLYKNYLVVTEDGYMSHIATLIKQTALSKLESFVVSDMGLVKNMKVLDVKTQPEEKGPCHSLNGGCEHICIPIGRNRLCHCDYGFKLDADKKSCSSMGPTYIRTEDVVWCTTRYSCFSSTSAGIDTDHSKVETSVINSSRCFKCGYYDEPLLDNFLLVTDWTHNKIYQVSLDSNDVRAIDTNITGSPNGIAFDHVTKEVIWGDTTNFNVQKVKLNGSGYDILRQTDLYGSHPDRFAIDFNTGNIFYTLVPVKTLGFAGVGVISPNGLHKKLIKSDGMPRDIVVDPRQGVLFWSDHNSVQPFVKRANMDGTSVRTIISKNIKWPNGLAIDYKAQYIYLTDGSLNTIQRCTYMGICTVLYTDDGAHLMDIDILGDYLYYAAWNRPHITKLHKTDQTRVSLVATNAELGRLDALTLYKSAEVNQPESTACKANNGLGPCSTFCLPTPTGYTCQCEDGVILRSDRKTCENVELTTKTTTTTSTTTTTTTTTPSTTSSTTLASTTTVALSNPTLKQVSTGPIVAGVGISMMSIIAIIVVLVYLLVIRRRRANKDYITQHVFQNPQYHDFSLIAETGGAAPGDVDRPDSNYASFGDILDMDDDDNCANDTSDRPRSTNPYVDLQPRQTRYRHGDGMGRNLEVENLGYEPDFKSRSTCGRGGQSDSLPSGNYDGDCDSYLEPKMQYESLRGFHETSKSPSEHDDASPNVHNALAFKINNLTQPTNGDKYMILQKVDSKRLQSTDPMFDNTKPLQLALSVDASDVRQHSYVDMTGEMHVTRPKLALPTLDNTRQGSYIDMSSDELRKSQNASLRVNGFNSSASLDSYVKPTPSEDGPSQNESLRVNNFNSSASLDSYVEPTPSEGGPSQSKSLWVNNFNSSASLDSYVEPTPGEDGPSQSESLRVNNFNSSASLDSYVEPTPDGDGVPPKRLPLRVDAFNNNARLDKGLPEINILPPESNV